MATIMQVIFSIMTEKLWNGECAGEDIGCSGEFVEITSIVFWVCEIFFTKSISRIIRPPLLYIMASHLFGIEPSSEPTFRVIDWTFGNKFQWHLIKDETSFKRMRLTLKSIDFIHLCRVTCICVSELGHHCLRLWLDDIIFNSSKPSGTVGLRTCRRYGKHSIQHKVMKWKSPRWALWLIRYHKCIYLSYPTETSMQRQGVGKSDLFHSMLSPIL